MNQSGLGRLLMQGGFISSEADLEHHLKLASEKSENLISTIVREKKQTYLNIATLIANKFKLSYFDLNCFDMDLVASNVDIKFIESHKFIPLKKTHDTMHIAVSDPTSYPLSELKFQIGVSHLNVVIVEENKLSSFIHKYLQNKGGVIEAEIDTDILLDFNVPEEEEEKQIDDGVEDAPVVKFIQAVLIEAIRLKVSDIHFEPYQKTYRIRYRLDGVLFESKKVPTILKEKIASRIKVISNMDISEKRVPQDGRFKLSISKDKNIDFRVSTLPTLWGEKIVMRILDASTASLDIDKLGYDDAQKKLLLEAVRRPYGMVLVTGPTGSGKTLSLYSCLNILNNEDVNICTAEDPAEINMVGVNQVNINEKAGLTFANALKSFLRQDPDTILVGEIRDLETADIAIKAAQTGHMVLSTLHTNDAPKTITRLLNMGVKPFNIASSVVLVTAQRLARRLCPHCKEEEVIPRNALLDIGMREEEIEGYGTTWKSYKPVGCNDCNNKGYKGRVGIYQVMPVTEEMRKIVLNEGSDLEIAECSRKDGVLSLREAGLKKVKEGITSIEEVIATTNID